MPPRSGSLRLLLAALLLTWGPGARADTLLAYVSSNASFYALDPATGVMTSQPTPPGYFNMDFAPDGTLYALDRSTDALYRINAPGSATYLRSIGVDSIGGGFTVSNDGQFAYFTNHASATDETDILYRYSIGTGQLQTMGAISGPFGISDIEFGLDGTLYAVTGKALIASNCSVTDRALYSINLGTLAGTKLGPTELGLSLGCHGIVSSLDATADGVMRMLVKPGDTCCTNQPRYFGTIDISTGQGTIDFSKTLTLNGSTFTAGASAAFYSVVPLPPTVWLLGQALFLAGALRTRRR